MRAVAGPLTGAPSIEIATGSSRSLLRFADAFTKAEALRAALMSCPALAASTAMRARAVLWLQGGSSTRQRATSIWQPQGQPNSRITASTCAFCAPVNPVKFTPGKSVAARHCCWANTVKESPSKVKISFIFTRPPSARSDSVAGIPQSSCEPPWGRPSHPVA